MKIISMFDSINDPSIITPWTFIHYLAGLTLFFIFNLFIEEDLVNIIIINIIHLCYELKDYYYTYIKSSGNSFIYYFSINNTVINSIGDTIFFLIGIFTAIYLKYNKYVNKKIEKYKEKCKLKINNKYIFFIIFTLINCISSYLFVRFNFD